jgi:hypothetical protein
MGVSCEDDDWLLSVVVSASSSVGSTGISTGFDGDGIRSSGSSKLRDSTDSPGPVFLCLFVITGKGSPG